LEGVAYAEGCDEAEEHPCLVVELEDRVDAIPELVAQVDEFRGKDEEGTEGQEEEREGK
jgi:hypothetical protein